MTPALLFDLDGTLIDSLADITAAANSAILPLGLGPYAREKVQRGVGNGAAALIRFLLPDTLSDQIDGSVERFLEYYFANPAEYASVFPGIPEMLERLADVPKIVVSNKHQKVARDVLHILKLDHYFAAVYGGDSFEQRKPSPFPILQALLLNGLATHNAMMVGDSVVDILAGRAARIRTCGVAWGWSSATELELCHPDHLIQHPLELVRLFASS